MYVSLDNMTKLDYNWFYHCKFTVLTLPTYSYIAVLVLFYLVSAFVKSHQLIIIFSGKNSYGLPQGVPPKGLPPRVAPTGCSHRSTFSSRVTSPVVFTDQYNAQPCVKFNDIMTSRVWRSMTSGVYRISGVPYLRGCILSHPLTLVCACDYTAR